jgi:hypothetical protein
VLILKISIRETTTVLLHKTYNYSVRKIKGEQERDGNPLLIIFKKDKKSINLLNPFS